ncbi:hypothetical protein [Planktosalinus lacus]|uniref:Uncharacterized protein n=1 Tax=Planktosalinus lacus TaxID=1526573 RepID=A0A8J2V9G6_9FLAO|nr:hypothetical protein [Planktosalinus lacus]GGD87431.1 hypothetical protein GCM10011312_09360 [Planktosalinus lacus]
MKNTFFLVAFIIAFSSTAYSQKSLSEFAFVVVPQQFEFQKGKDQFRLNTLTRHLFSNAGFNAIYDVEMNNLPRCEGLYAEVIENSSFLSTTVTVVLKDCNQNVVFTSAEGSSKEKAYEKAYQEAIRNAFKSLEVLAVNQGDLESYRERLSKEDAPSAPIQMRPEVKKSQSDEQMASKKLPAYVFKGTTYLLEPNKEGFILYKKESKSGGFSEYGSLTETSREGTYLFVKDGKSHLASFDAENNLIIDGVDEKGKPTQNRYLKIKTE